MVSKENAEFQWFKFHSENFKNAGINLGETWANYANKLTKKIIKDLLFAMYMVENNKWDLETCGHLFFDQVVHIQMYILERPEYPDLNKSFLAFVDSLEKEITRNHAVLITEYCDLINNRERAWGKNGRPVLINSVGSGE